MLRNRPRTYDGEASNMGLVSLCFGGEFGPSPVWLATELLPCDSINSRLLPSAKLIETIPTVPTLREHNSVRPTGFHHHHHRRRRRRPRRPFGAISKLLQTKSER